MRRMLALAQKELIQLRRDRLTFAMIVGIPVIQLLLFGYAINSDVRHMPTVVLDHDRSGESRDLVHRLVVTLALGLLFSTVVKTQQQAMKCALIKKAGARRPPPGCIGSC